MSTPVSSPEKAKARGHPVGSPGKQKARGHWQPSPVSSSNKPDKVELFLSALSVFFFQREEAQGILSHEKKYQES
jgi:hypothetical protein